MVLVVLLVVTGRIRLRRFRRGFAKGVVLGLLFFQERQMAARGRWGHRSCWEACPHCVERLTLGPFPIRPRVTA